MKKKKNYPLDNYSKKEKEILHKEYYSDIPTLESITYMNGLRSGRIKPVKLN